MGLSLYPSEISNALRDAKNHTRKHQMAIVWKNKQKSKNLD